MSASVKLFADISPTNQRKKLQLIDAIRTNWGCDVQECIPVAIRPRKNTSDGKRPKTGAAASLEDDPKEWSLSLLADLAMLSRSTTGKLTLAQSLLQTAVRERQSGMFANQPRTTAGLVRGDVQRAVESLKPSAPERNDRYVCRASAILLSLTTSCYVSLTLNESHLGLNILSAFPRRVLSLENSRFWY